MIEFLFGASFWGFVLKVGIYCGIYYLGGWISIRKISKYASEEQIRLMCKTFDDDMAAHRALKKIKD